MPMCNETYINENRPTDSNFKIFLLLYTLLSTLLYTQYGFSPVQVPVFTMKALYCFEMVCLYVLATLGMISVH